MSEWDLYFKTTEEKMVKFISELIDKENIYNESIELKAIGKPGGKKKKININNIKEDQIHLLYISTTIHAIPNKDDWSICKVLFKKPGEGINHNELELIKSMGDTLSPSEFKLICEEEGPSPIYRGKWNYKQFIQKLKPIIEQ